jgi:hypothetical protein
VEPVQMMTTDYFQVRPKIPPPLDQDFLPAALFNRAMQAALRKEKGGELILGLERNDGEISRFKLTIFPEDSENYHHNNYFVERIVKFLLWQRGGWKLYVIWQANIQKVENENLMSTFWVSRFLNGNLK